MSENEVVTCASCGKVYKGVKTAGKQFKCTQCSDLLHTLDDSGDPKTGKILCGNCWSGIELREELYSTSQRLMGDVPADSAKQSDFEGREIEMRTRIQMLEENVAAAQRERDLAAESKKKVEQTLSEFLGKFASVREKEVHAMKERDAALEGKRKLEKEQKDLQVQLQLAQETEAAAMADRNSSVQIHADLEAQVTELKTQLQAAQSRADTSIRRNLDEKVQEYENQLAALREELAQLSADRSKSERQRADAETKMNDMQLKLTAAQDAAARAKEEGAAEYNEMRNTLGDLHAELVGAQVDAVAMRAERDVAITARQEMEAKLKDLQDRLDKAQEAQAQALKERDEVVMRTDKNATELNDVKAELARLREAAIATLEPLGNECNQNMKLLAAETDKILGETRQIHEETNGRIARIEEMLAELRAHVHTTRKHVTGRVSMVLGVPAGESVVAPAVRAAQSNGKSRAIAAGE